MTGLLSIDLTPRQRRALVDNILRVYDAATEDQRKRGAEWYPTAHDIAAALHPDLSIGAGVLAALSANKGWDQNVRLAQDAVLGGLIRHTKAASAKALRILAGEEPLEVLGGPKTINFYYNIRWPESPTPVTIDRHAHDIALGMPYGDNPRGLSAGKRYAILADAYRDAAQSCGVLPSTMQATTWLVWREDPRRNGRGQWTS